MIYEMSQSAQFILTTFRPEMIAIANKFYGVTFANRISRIQSITKEAAMEFIEDQNENLPPENATIRKDLDKESFIGNQMNVDDGHLDQSLILS